MAETILSVGIDIGTSTTQLIFSRLTVENRAGAFAVPDLTISRREILYESPIHFTPLKSAEEIDGPALKALAAKEYEAAGIGPGDVQTGAIIITGETARKENAREALTVLGDFAGDPIWRASWRPGEPERTCTARKPGKPCCTWTSAAEQAILRC